jgi:uncharacterized membrane protein YkvA (DUF1232 family)
MTFLKDLQNWAQQIKRDGISLWFASKHPLTPWYAKAIGFFVVAYALSPIDLIPDFIPILGYVDDVTGLTGNNMSYDATQNAATQITVALP